MSLADRARLELDKHHTSVGSAEPVRQSKHSLNGLDSGKDKTQKVLEVFVAGAGIIGFLLLMMAVIGGFWAFIQMIAH